MLIRRAKEIPSSEITPENAYLNRREFMAEAAAGSAAAVPVRGGGEAARAGQQEKRTFEEKRTLQLLQFRHGQEPARTRRTPDAPCRSR